MQTLHLRARLLASVAATSLLFTSAASPLALAAPGPTPPGAAQPAVAQAGDPPTRAGRVARLDGTVSFRTADADHWDTATLNFPVTSNDDFWTEPQAESDLEVSGNRIIMAPSTEFDVNTLDDHALQATLPQGAVYLRLLNVPQGDSYSVVTPRGTVAITAPGRYEVVAGDTSNPTLVTVLEGGAQVTAQGVDLAVGANQTATITGADTFQGAVGAAQKDQFLTAMLERERPPAVGQAAPPPVVQHMTGGADLAEYGTWQPVAEYGQVWYPKVDPGYVPYRDGHWAYVAPWGWTWVDNAPWGFAPSHYGRWVQVDNRWGWTPGYAGEVDVAYGAPGYVAPVYAPAVVGFFGVGVGIAAGVGIGIGIGALAAGGSIGWCPLGWHQPYYPPYRASAAYFGGLNRGYVPQSQYSQISKSYVDNSTHYQNNSVHTTTINNITNNYASAAGATVAPAAAFTTSRTSLAAVARAPTAAQVAAAKPVIGTQVIAPNRATPGVTQHFAATHHLAAPPAGVHLASATVATGPAITKTATPGARTALAGKTALPALAPAKTTGVAAAEKATTEKPTTAATPKTATAIARPAAPGPAITPRSETVSKVPALRENTAPVTAAKPVEPAARSLASTAVHPAAKTQETAKPRAIEPVHAHVNPQAPAHPAAAPKKIEPQTSVQPHPTQARSFAAARPPAAHIHAAPHVQQVARVEHHAPPAPHDAPKKKLEP